MRYYEISSGLRIPVSQEEQDIINICLENKGLEVNLEKLDERQQEICRLMVGRGLLNRHNGKTSLNSAVDIWRF